MPIAQMGKLRQKQVTLWGVGVVDATGTTEMGIEILGISEGHREGGRAAGVPEVPQKWGRRYRGLWDHRDGGKEVKRVLGYHKHRGRDSEGPQRERKEVLGCHRHGVRGALGVQRYHRDGDMGCRGYWKTSEMRGKGKGGPGCPQRWADRGKGVLEDQRDRRQGCTVSWGTTAGGEGSSGHLRGPHR